MVELLHFLIKKKKKFVGTSASVELGLGSFSPGLGTGPGVLQLAAAPQGPGPMLRASGAWRGKACTVRARERVGASYLIVKSFLFYCSSALDNISDANWGNLLTR